MFPKLYFYVLYFCKFVQLKTFLIQLFFFTTIQLLKRFALFKLCISIAPQYNYAAKQKQAQKGKHFSCWVSKLHPLTDSDENAVGYGSQPRAEWS